MIVDEKGVKHVILDLNCHLTDKGQTIGFYSDGCGRIVLETTEMDISEVVMLAAYGRRKSFSVKIDIENPTARCT